MIPVIVESKDVAGYLITWPMEVEMKVGMYRESWFVFHVGLLPASFLS